MYTCTCMSILYQVDQCFVQGLSYKGVQDRQVSVVIFFSYIYNFFFCFAVGMGKLKCCNKNNNNNK